MSWSVIIMIIIYYDVYKYAPKNIHYHQKLQKYMYDIQLSGVYVFYFFNFLETVD